MRAGPLAKQGLLLAITGVSLYLLAPALLEVFGAFDELDDFNPLWYVAMVALQVEATPASGGFRSCRCAATMGP